MTKLHLLAYAAEWLRDRERKGQAKIGAADDAAAVRDSYDAYMLELSNKIPFVPPCISSRKPPKPYLTCESSNSGCSGSTLIHTVGHTRKRTRVSAFLGEEYLPLSWGAFSSNCWIKKRIIYIVDLHNSKRQKHVYEPVTDDDNKVLPVMQPQIIPPKPEQTRRKKKKITKKKEKKKITKKKKEKKKEKKQEKTIITYFGPTPPPDLDRKYRDYIGRMGGTDIHLVIQKPIYDSDLKNVLNRLSIPVSKIDENMIFTEQERLDMRTEIDGDWFALVVPLIDIDLHTTHMISVKRWNMGKKNGTNNPMYVLTKTWNKSDARKNLAAGDIIQLWSFRVESRLHLVLLLVETKPEEGALVPLLLNN